MSTDATVYFQTVFDSDIKLEFEESSYSIKLSYGRKGQVFRFKPRKKAVKVVDKDVSWEFVNQPESDELVSQTKYPFGGNYSLENVPGIDQQYWEEFEMLENF